MQFIDLFSLIDWLIDRFLLIFKFMIRLNTLFSRLNIVQQSQANKFFYSSDLKEVPRQYTDPIKTKLEIVGRDQVNHNCYIFKFKFAGPSFPLRMSQHFRITETFPTYKNQLGE